MHAATQIFPPTQYTPGSQPLSVMHRILLTSMNQIKTILHRHAQGAILQLILGSAKLRSNINCDNLLVRDLETLTRLETLG